MKISTFTTRLMLVAVIVAAFVSNAFAGKTVKIKLTGSSYEPILMSIGNSGRTEVISSLPYTLEISKTELPCRLRFQSENYLYYDIDVPKKPFDDTGHIYLVKINETAMALRGNSSSPAAAGGATKIMGQSNLDSPIVGIDVTHGVNAAPITGKNNDKTVALIITNENYEMAGKVENAINDGLAFKEYCLKTFGLPAGNIKYSSNVTYGKMKKAISDALDLVELFGGEGNLIVYYAGHGIPDNKTKEAYLMPVDADGTDTEVCIPLSGLYNLIDSKNIDRCVVFLDACFSGAQRGGDMIVDARGVKLKPKEAVPSGKTIVFSATSDNEAAFSHNGEDHGLFTYYLLSKLQKSKGDIKLGDLADYLIENVAIESRRINNIPQTPKVTVSPGVSDNWRALKLIK